MNNQILSEVVPGVLVADGTTANDVRSETQGGISGSCTLKVSVNANYSSSESEINRLEKLTAIKKYLPDIDELKWRAIIEVTSSEIDTIDDLDSFEIAVAKNCPKFDNKGDDLRDLVLPLISISEDKTFQALIIVSDSAAYEESDDVAKYIKLHYQYVSSLSSWMHCNRSDEPLLVVSQEWSANFINDYIAKNECFVSSEGSQMIYSGFDSLLSHLESHECNE